MTEEQSRRKGEEEKEHKRMMEKQAEEEKKKKLEEDEIMASESILNFSGEDMPSFSLNITQMIQETQRDRASEEKNSRTYSASEAILKRSYFGIL